MRAAPPAGLAVADWGTPAPAVLDLRYAPDEAELLDPSPARVWEDVVAASPRLGADAAGRYPVEDPYGGERGAGAVGRCFGVALEPGQVTFAAGVTALLHGLAALAGTGTVVASELAHPDLGVWAAARGAAVRVVPAPLDAERVAATAGEPGCTLVQVDRPAFGGEVLSLGELELVCRAAARAGAVVVVDEAPAPYLGPAASAIPLAVRLDNLVVLRGFTKAYSLGGMRVGFAVASPGAAERVRAAVPPLQVGEVSFEVALRLLEAGDVCARLRRRIRVVKPVAAALLAGAGLAVEAGHPDVPAVVVDDAGGAATAQLAQLGVRGLRAGAVLHLRVPIGDARLRLLRELVRPAVAAAVRG